MVKLLALETGGREFNPELLQSFRPRSRLHMTIAVGGT